MGGSTEVIDEPEAAIDSSFILHPSSLVVCLVSGGMDSCVCAALAARNYDAAALHVSYGQRTEDRERETFLAICQRLGIQDKLIVRNEALPAIGGSALTDVNIAVPEVACAAASAESSTL